MRVIRVDVLKVYRRSFMMMSQSMMRPSPPTKKNEMAMAFPIRLVVSVSAK